MKADRRGFLSILLALPFLRPRPPAELLLERRWVELQPEYHRRWQAICRDRLFNAGGEVFFISKDGAWVLEDPEEEL